MRLFLALLLGIPAFAQPAYLHGTILDPAGAVLVNASVQVISDTARCDTRSDGRGEFQCQLLPGTYTITSNIEAFFPYRRAPITLRAGHSVVKVRPALSTDLINDDTIYPPGVTPAIRPRDPGPNIEEHRVNGADLLIRYKDKTKANGLLSFRGQYLMLTSNLLAVYADEITCTDTFQSCTARGKVLVETGTGEELEGTQAAVDLVNHKLKLTRDATLDRTF